MDDKNDRQSKLQRGLEIFGNLFALNIVYIITCLPIITIGASTTALYAMTIKMIHHEEGTLIKTYFRIFRENFKKATIAWIIVMVACAVIWAEYLVVVGTGNSGYGSFYLFVGLIEIVLLALVLPFLFPLIGRYDNTLINTFKNSFLLSISNLGSWLKIVLIWVAPTYFSLAYPIIILNIWYLWLIIMFALMAWCSSLSVNNVFQKIAKTQEENEEKKKDPEYAKKLEEKKKAKKKNNKEPEKVKFMHYVNAEQTDENE